MSYFEKTRILAADSPSIDAFGKWRVSNPTTLFDSKQVVDSGSFYFDIKTVTGGTVTWNSGSAQSTMKVTSTSGSRAIKQTKRIFVYQPGKSQQIICTGKFDGRVDGIKKSIGSFDDNDGYFFQMSGSSFGVVLRKTINGIRTDTFISQSTWNLDKMNGSGPSGNILDTSKAQIYTMDYEWLGVGRVRYGVVQKGVLIYVHEIQNYNSLETVYLKNPNLPVRYEISTHKNTSTGSLMTQICSTVISEGGFQNTGKRQVITSNNGATIGASEYDGVLFIRYNSSTSKCAQIIPEQLDFLVEPGNNSPFSGRWDLLVNPTVTNAVTYNNASGSVVTQVGVVSTGNVITNPGTVIATGYFSGTGGAGINTQITLDPYYGLGRKIDGTSDILAVGIKTYNNTYTIYPSLIVRELT